MTSLSPGIENYVNMLDELADSTGLSREQSCIQAMRSLIENPGFPFIDIYAREMLQVAISRQYTGLILLILDHYQVPVDLNLKERLAYHNLMKEKS